MEQQTNFNANATLCRAGCGFFGSSATDGMCSKCFKDASNRKMQTQSSSPSVITVTPASSTSATSADPASPSGIGSMNSSFRDLVTSPVSIPSYSTSSSFASSVPISLTAHMPHPASSISLANAGAASPSSLDIAILNSPSSSSLPGSFSDSASPMSEASKKKNRCAECNKKVGLTGFECRCGGTYCPLHRYSDMHKCDFDYKQMGADEIRKNNPAVRGEKVQKL